MREAIFGPPPPEKEQLRQRGAMIFRKWKPKPEKRKRGWFF
jgi:hypothetical protein